MIEIQQEPQERKCYLCGRTEADFRKFYPLATIAAKANARAIELSRKRDAMLKDKINFFESLLVATASYPQDITVDEILQGEAISSKTMPRYKELLMYKPWKEQAYHSNRKEKDTTTVKELRARVSSLLQQLEAETIPDELKSIDAEWVTAIAALTCPQPEKESQFDLPPWLRFSKKNMGFFVDIYGQFVSPEQRPKDKVINLDTYVYLCGICARLLKEASGAAFQVQEAQRIQCDDCD